MALNYTLWTDARAHLDSQIHTEAVLDVDRLTTLCEEAELKFDAKVGQHYTVPFVLATAPKSFAIAKAVCSRWAAAAYDREKREAQTIGPGEMAWADRLEKAAEDFLVLLESNDKAPSDATRNESGVVTRPSDGETADTAPAAIFTRDQITKGNAYHW